jgi:cobalamin-dependent methionine synthase I
MLSQTFDIQTLPTPKVFIHIITLLNRQTGDEVSLHIETGSDRFKEVLLELTHQKVMHNLFGYEIFEVLDCNDPF